VSRGTQGRCTTRSSPRVGLRLTVFLPLKSNKLFYSFWITPRRGETLRVSTRHRPSDVWALTGALTSHIGLHCLRFSDMFNGERDRADRSRSIFGDMISWFHESSKWRFLLYSYGNFLAGFFCYLTFAMLENMS
jgi:hypothetical protein